MMGTYFIACSLYLYYIAARMCIRSFIKSEEPDRILLKAQCTCPNTVAVLKLLLLLFMIMTLRKRLLLKKKKHAGTPRYTLRISCVVNVQCQKSPLT